MHPEVFVERYPDFHLREARSQHLSFEDRGRDNGRIQKIAYHTTRSDVSNQGHTGQHARLIRHVAFDDVSVNVDEYAHNAISDKHTDTERRSRICNPTHQENGERNRWSANILNVNLDSGGRRMPPSSPILASERAANDMFYEAVRLGEDECVGIRNVKRMIYMTVSYRAMKTMYGVEHEKAMLIQVHSAAESSNESDFSNLNFAFILILACESS